MKKDLSRQRRLQSGKEWLETLEDGLTYKQIVRRYSKKFNVPLPCAIRELKSFGVMFPEGYYEMALHNYKCQIEDRTKRNLEKKQKKELDDLIESDENFYYIAGYTSSGFPYGITCEEYYRQEEKGKSEDEIYDEIDLPF